MADSSNKGHKRKEEPKVAHAEQVPHCHCENYSPILASLRLIMAFLSELHSLELKPPAFPED